MERIVRFSDHVRLATSLPDERPDFPRSTARQSSSGQCGAALKRRIISRLINRRGAIRGRSRAGCYTLYYVCGLPAYVRRLPGLCVDCCWRQGNSCQGWYFAHERYFPSSVARLFAEIGTGLDRVV